MTSRGIRNNNPGNIRRSATHFRGEKESTDNAFKQFTSMEMGYRAMFKILNTYYFAHNLRTIAKIINRWAPTNENDTKAYVSRVSHLTGFAPNAYFKWDIVNLCRLVTAISTVENGVDAKQEQVSAGWYFYNNF